MSLQKLIKDYSREITHLKDRGTARELSYRTPFENFVKQYAKTKGYSVSVIQEQKREDFGGPDFRVEQHDLIPVGYIETKDVVVSLEDIVRGKLKADKERLDKYLDAVPNLLLTNYEDFFLFRDAKKVASASLHETQRLEELLEDFFLYEYPPATKPEELANYLAKKCKVLRREILNRLKLEEGVESGERVVAPYYDAFKEYLMPSLEEDAFADAYAQTITYGLFLSKLHLGERFTRRSAREGIPKSIPLLRSLFDHISGELPPDVEWIINELVSVLSKAALENILKEFKFGDLAHDPFIHFYEDFLKVYNPKERQRRGVYYTPEPVVSYITRSIDKLLKSHFGKEGFEDKDVIILDPAVGTGTFLASCIGLIRQNLEKKGMKGTFNQVVETNILNNLFGFEILVSPYAICHLKLSRVLEDFGYHLPPKERFKVYLTNTLEFKDFKIIDLPFVKDLTKESHEANEIKSKRPVLVVLGNPPYSVSSDNKSDFIMWRLDDYKRDVKGERNIQPLDDDYIKFLRFAEWKIGEQNGEGIVGMITNNSYLFGLIHRGMRKHLIETFDEIYILNLHGNSLIGEKAPGGGKDENVFDIRVGTSIVLLVKRRNRSSNRSPQDEDNSKGRAGLLAPREQGRATSPALPRIYYHDIYGLRNGKYSFLMEHDVETVKWQELPQKGPYFFFVPKDFVIDKEYQGYKSLSEIFAKFHTGIVTHRDKFVINFEKECLAEKLREFSDSNIPDREISQKYALRNTRDWNLSASRKRIYSEGIKDTLFKPYYYRPFDIRWTYYSDAIIEFDRKDIMQHFISHENIGFSVTRQVNKNFKHIFVTAGITDRDLVSLATRERGYLFPLYLYIHHMKEGKEIIKKELNLTPEFLKEIKRLYGDVTPEEILYYIYAVLHSPVYRSRYAEFLKIDFPRIPLLPKKTFKSLSKIGEKLVNLHLLKDMKPPYPAKYEISGGHKVEKVKYDETKKRVYINEEQYFDNIPKELWEFHVGGYQVLQKWLKDRKDRTLSRDEIETYLKITKTIKETIVLMNGEALSTLSF